MANGVKRVFYVRYLAHPDYVDILGKRPDVRLDKLENESPDDVAAPILAAAHAYQIGSARDEIAPKYHVTRDLLARMPNLLVVSTNGAGYDTVEREGLHRRRRAGGQSDRRQPRGRGAARARHDAVPVEAHRRDRPGAAPRHARRPQPVHGPRDAGAHHRHRRLRATSAGASRSSAVLLGMQVLAYDPYLSAETIAARDATKVELDELLRAVRFRVDQLPAHRRDARHDRRARVRPDAAARLLHHHGARLHP